MKVLAVSDRSEWVNNQVGIHFHDVSEKTILDVLQYKRMDTTYNLSLKSSQFQILDFYRDGMPSVCPKILMLVKRYRRREGWGGVLC